MNIIRGTTVSGLCGIPPVNGNVIRPLLKISREENEAFLKENNFSFVTDSTNSDNDITRNYIRNILLPCAKKINPLAIEAADRLSAYARNDEDYFDLILDNISDDVKDSELYPAVLRRKLQREYAEITGGKSLMAVHIDALISLAGNKNGKILSMPDNIEAEVIDGNIKFISKKDSNYPKKLSDSGIYELKFGKNNFADGKIRILCSKINTGTDENIYNNYTQIILDFGKIVGSVRYRQRQAGDRIMCRGVNRSIKKEFNEKHVPPEIRDAVPVFFDDEGIIYVPFVGACDRVYHRGNSKAPVMIDVHFWAGISE